MIPLCVLILTAFQPCETGHQHVLQPYRSKSVHLGDPVTLECYTDAENVLTWVWFKNTVEHGLRTVLIVSYGNLQLQGPFAGDSRVTVQKNRHSCNLSLSNVSLADAASYHCGIQWFGTWHFGDGTFLVLKDLQPIQVIQKFESDSVNPGDSVTLQCTVDGETCAGEHSVYWFRHGSGESLPGLLYTHGNRSDECEKSPEAGSPTRSCLYSLPKRNLSRSDAGTYYCAVVTCGEILFGNGTKLEIEDVHDSVFIYLSLVAVIIVSLALNIVLIVMSRKGRRVRTGMYQRDGVCTSVQDDQADDMNYAALSFASHKSQRRRAQKVDSELLYSAMRQ